MSTFTFNSPRLRRQLFIMAEVDLESAKKKIVEEAQEKMKDAATAIMARYALIMADRPNDEHISNDVRIELVDRSAPC